MRRLVLTGVSAVAIVAGIAGAGIGAANAAEPARLIAPFGYWNGAYVGATVGQGAYETYNDSSTITATGTGPMAGITAGFNVQNGNMVYGLEGDWSHGSIWVSNGDHVDTVDTIATIRGRLGVTMNNILFYGTAGAGWISGNNYSSDPDTFRVSDFRLVYGVGAELALSNKLSVKAEVLHLPGSVNIPFDDIETGKGVTLLRFGVNFKL